MNLLAYIVVFALLGGLLSLLGGILLLRNQSVAKALAYYATPFAGGALLAAAFLDLLKEAMKIETAATVLLATLVGIIIFFLAEGWLHWFHHHHIAVKSNKDPKIWLIIAGDALHNSLDGVAIAAGFLISVPVGIVTTVAVAAHEIPHEIGDYGLLLSKGLRRKEVLLANAATALATLLGAIITYWLGSANALPVGVLLGVSSGFLIYIALSDIVPTIHAKDTEPRLFDIQALLLLLGIFTVGLLTSVASRFIS